MHVTESPGVVHVTLPDGPLTAVTCGALVDLCVSVRERRDVHVVQLDSGTPTFGGDARSDPPDVVLGTNPPALLADLPQIVVMSIEGHCSSTALELSLAADLRVAGADASFELSDAARGFIPAWGGTQRLVRLVGRSTALRMMLLGEIVDAEGARTLGLVTHTAPSGAATTVASDLVTTLCRQAPLALEYAKEAVMRGAEMTMRDGLGLEADLNLMLRASNDRREGIDAFLAKRQPKFEGR
jgi:enoyl-CoA hydratase/carnithine racemase